MRLESVTLHGFKSFGEKAVVKVLPGITGIVGPNGCGKSNISESIRWALGEQSAKALRGHRMDELIFHGSASRKPVGLAEVELLFSNDGNPAVPFSEVAVTRRLYRTGESEYLLNKSVCRLRDIVDLFAGTGASPRAYSVMDQEKLNHVLTAKPHERRLFIEEAAGIARYKQQRTETQGKLDATRHNLTRVRDVMEEVKRQLTSLERQAKKAQQYKALQQERRELALTLVAADYATLSASGARLDAEVAGLRTEEEALQVRLAALAGREALAREAIQESDHRLSDLRQSVQKVQGELERLLERREQMTVQQRESSDEAARLEQEITAMHERLAGLVAERETMRMSLHDAEQQASARAEAARALEFTVEQHRAGLHADRDRLEALRLEQVRLATERTDLMRQAGELRERRAQLDRRAERLAGELAAAEAEAARLGAQRTAVEQARARAVADLESLRIERTDLESQLKDRDDAIAEATARRAELRVALASRQSSAASLRELERAREGYGAGVRAIFADGQSSHLGGVVGTVADLLDVPRGLERAVEAVLGERLQWIVVDRFDDARAAVGFLDGRGAGSATFLPLDCLPEREGHHSSNGTRWVAAEVAAPRERLVQYLLGSVALVDDLDRAEMLWRKNGVVATYVTPTGEVLTSTGRLKGGVDVGGDEHSLLGRKRQLRELDEQIEILEAELAQVQSGLAALEIDAASLRSRLPLLTQAIAASETARVASEKDLEQWGREDERITRHRATVETEARQVRSEGDEAAEMLDRVERRAAIAREAETAHEGTMTGLRETIDRGQRDESQLLAELTACRVEAASAAERVDALRREIGRIDEIEADLTDRIAQAEQRRAQALDRAAWLADERQRTDETARHVAVQRDRLEEHTRSAAAGHEELVADHRGIETEARGLEAEVRALTSSIHDLDLRATEGRVRREELAQEAKRTYGIAEDDLLGRHDAEVDLEAIRQRVDELAEKLEAFGGVNLVADEEYQELDERLTFLRTQHDDLIASMKDLEKALRGMTHTAQERFAQAFEEINGQFQRIFERLFEGGRAELRIVPPEDGDDPLDTGIELMAQPRGKRLGSVTLMSGGERALTGLALLFAIFYYRPSPFCVLDEVDAPLDDANIVRFLRVLRELTSQTQFLVITHNRKTMEAADILYGVTMEEPGLSKLVSVNLNQ